MQTSNAQCDAGVLYAITRAGTGTASSLYTIDPTTGGATLVGSTGLTEVTGIAAHPTTNELYAWSNGTQSLYTIDPATAAATPVGAGGSFTQIPDIDFNSTGELYGWAEYGGSASDDLVSIDIVTGASTLVGSGSIPGISALDFCFFSVIVVPPVSGVPTMGQLGLIILGLTFLIF